jgi:CheY-like chemotaxis protein
MTGMAVNVESRSNEIYLPPTKILCVDDSKDSCELVSFILSEAGYEIKSAYTMTEGLQMAQSDEFQLYLIDLSFSDGSGMDFIEKIREIDSLTPIVVCSGDVREVVLAEAISLGAQAFLTKPIDPDTLAQTIAEMLDDQLQH